MSSRALVSIAPSRHVDDPAVPGTGKPSSLRDPDGSGPPSPTAPARPVTEPASRPALVAPEGNGRPAGVEGGAFRLATPRARIGESDADTRTLATAVFVAGSARLAPGHRYGLAVRRSRLLVLGPIDLDPSAVVLDRAVAEIEARAVDGRLVMSEPRSRSGIVLAFMSVAGPTTADLAAQITEAARTAGPA